VEKKIKTKNKRFAGNDATSKKRGKIEYYEINQLGKERP